MRLQKTASGFTVLELILAIVGVVLLLSLIAALTLGGGGGGSTTAPPTTNKLFGVAVDWDVVHNAPGAQYCIGAQTPTVINVRTEVTNLPTFIANQLSSSGVPATAVFTANGPITISPTNITISESGAPNVQVTANGDGQATITVEVTESVKGTEKRTIELPGGGAKYEVARTC